MAVAGGTAPGTAVYGQPGGQRLAAVDNAGGLSPYGTMGQGGNTWEWTESSWGPNSYPDSSRGIRGGSHASTITNLTSSRRVTQHPSLDGIRPFYGSGTPRPRQIARARLFLIST